MDSEKKLFCPVISEIVEVFKDNVKCPLFIVGKCGKLGQNHLVGTESDCVLVRQSTDNGLSGLTPGIFFRLD